MKKICMSTNRIYGMMMGHIKLLSIIVICKLPHEQFDLVNKNNMTFLRFEDVIYGHNKTTRINLKNPLE